MKVLHTSDWHIGTRFHGVNLLDEQIRFGDWLLKTSLEESVEVVLIAGDLYDVVQPSGKAVRVLDSIFNSLLQAGIQIVCITGNHDSAQRLSFGNMAMSEGGLHLSAESPDLDDVGKPITIEGAQGEKIQVVPVPYLNPFRVTNHDLDDVTHQSLVESVLDRARDEVEDPQRTIVMGHGFFAGGSNDTVEETGSERRLSVGGEDRIGFHVLKGWGYVALGHLHRHQEFDQGRIAYSGSPLPMSFSEEHQKFVRIIDCGDSITPLTPIAIPDEVVRPVKTITAELEHVVEMAGSSDWVRVVLADDSIQPGAMNRIRSVFPNILEVIQPRPQQIESPSVNREEDLSPGDIVELWLDDYFPSLDTRYRQTVNDSVNETLAGVGDETP